MEEVAEWIDDTNTSRRIYPHASSTQYLKPRIRFNVEQKKNGNRIKHKETEIEFHQHLGIQTLPFKKFLQYAKEFPSRYTKPTRTGGGGGGVKFTVIDSFVVQAFLIRFI